MVFCFALACCNATPRPCLDCLVCASAKHEMCKLPLELAARKTSLAASKRTRREEFTMWLLLMMR